MVAIKYNKVKLNKVKRSQVCENDTGIVCIVY